MDVYLDHAASTPARPEVVEAMMPWLAEHPGNPSGAHRVARNARRAFDDARDTIAELLGSDPGEVVFTSGGTESDNLAVDGVLGAHGGVAICGATEHPAVLDPVELSGGIVVPTDRMGCIDLTALSATLDSSSEIRLVSIMAVNNETGVVNNIPDAASVVAKISPGTFLHTDAVQAAAWMDLREICSGAHLVSLTGHKIGGPKGAGVLVLRGGTSIAPVIRGGGQERERRSGTQNVPAIVGLGVAAGLVMLDRDTTVRRIAALRDCLEVGLLERIRDCFRTVPEGVKRSPAITNLCFPGIESESLLFLLERRGISASAASSCSSGAQEPSHVLEAMGISREAALGSLRLSLGYVTTEAEIDYALQVIPDVVEHLQGQV